MPSISRSKSNSRLNHHHHRSNRYSLFPSRHFIIFSISILFLIFLIVYNSSLQPNASIDEISWEEDNVVPSTSEPVTLLPVCNRTLLFEFGHLHGFASEYTLFLRLALLANHYRYTIFPLSLEFNYGPLETYFDTVEVECRAPSLVVPRIKLDWTSYISPPSSLSYTSGNRHIKTRTTRKGIEVGDPNWVQFDHVVWKVRDFDAVDSLLSELFINQVELEYLKLSDADGNLDSELEPSLDSVNLLEEEEKEGKGSKHLIPGVFELVFRREAEVLKEYWKFNDEMKSLVDRSQSYQKPLPVSSTQRESSKVDIIIGAHVRLGDKYLEIDRHLGPGIQSSTITTYFESATLLVNSFNQNISSLRRIEAGTSTTINSKTTMMREEQMKSTLVIMSDDSGIGNLFREHELSSGFTIVELSDSLVSSAKEKTFQKEGGFYEGSFNHLELAQRKTLTKKFLLELNNLSSSRINGLVLSSSSNVGRLLTLLASDLSLKGRVLSIDSRWFPTSHYL